jgi:hypothetical protein
MKENVCGIIWVYILNIKGHHSSDLLMHRFYCSCLNVLIVSDSTDPLYVHRMSCYLFGRERKVADVPTDHPSCSKQHAVLQYRHVYTLTCLY